MPPPRPLPAAAASGLDRWPPRVYLALNTHCLSFFLGGAYSPRVWQCTPIVGSQKISPIEISTIPELLMLGDVQKSEAAYQNLE